MKHLFMDTNVVIDFLANREPFARDAAILFNLADTKNIKIHIAAISYTNMYYVLRPSLGHTKVLNVLQQLAAMTEIAEVNDKIIQQSLTSDFKDYEDAVQYYCALNIDSLDFIVTRNTKDFKKSALPIITSREAISILNAN